MRVTIKELRRIIKEEYAKVLEEGITTGVLDNPEVLKELANIAQALVLKDKELPARLSEIIDHNLRIPITLAMDAGDKGSYMKGFETAANNLTIIQDAILGVTPEEREQLNAFLANQEAQAPAPAEEADPSFPEETS